MGDIGIPIHTEDVALFSVPPVNVAEDKIMWVEHLPTYSNANGNGSIQFTIPGTGTQYTDLSRTELYVKVKVLDDKGNVFKQDADWRTAIPIDNVLHSLWSTVDIKFNSTLVSSSGTDYTYKAYFETLLNFNKSAKEYQLSSIGFSGDRGNFDQTDPDEVPYSYGLGKRYDWWKAIGTWFPKRRTPYYRALGSGGRDSNPSHKKKRSVRTTGEAKSAEDDNDEALIPLPIPLRKVFPQDSDEEWDDPTCVEFAGPLLADVCNQDRLILNGVDIDIKLWPNRDDFRLITFPNGTEAHIKIETIKLNVCKVSVAPPTLLAIEKTLEETNAIYPFSRSEIRTFNLAEGSFNEVYEDLFQGEVPDRLLVGMVDSSAYNGDFQRNPLRFKHFNVASMGFYVDGEPTPRAPYEFDFKDCEYLQGLQSLYKVSGKWNENTDIGISRDDYRQGYCIVGFEGDPTSSGNNAYVGKRRKGRIRFTIRFHKALKKGVTIIFYATFPEVMEINQARLITLTQKENQLRLSK